MPQVFKRPAARRDLVAHYVYLAENAGEEVADRFLLNAQLSFEDLAAQPAMGATVKVRAPELDHVRKWRVREFESVLIFYVPRQSGVSILRVVHAAQDWWQLLGLDVP